MLRGSQSVNDYYWAHYGSKLILTHATSSFCVYYYTQIDNACSALDENYLDSACIT